VYNLILPADLREYLASSGLRVPLENAKGNTNNSQQVRSVAYQVIDFTQAPNPEPLDLADPNTEALVDALANADEIGSTEVGNFKSNWQRTARREEAVLGRGTSVSVQDVSNALN